jgi:hypothetical protein
MKTTIDIADRLLRDAKREAARRGSTLKEVVETALRRHLDEAAAPPAFILRDASVEGHGVRAGVEEGDWEAIRALVYEGHGA